MHERDYLYRVSLCIFEMMNEQYSSTVNIGLSEYVQYYRGQASIDYDLEPLLDREDCRLNGIYERRTIQEFIARRPEAFAGITNMFNLVSKMQHYGLATRLLDLTSNPAVALYFACCSYPDKDGEMFVFNTNKDAILTPGEADLIMRFYIYGVYGVDDNNEYNLQQFYKNIKDKYSEKELRQVIRFINTKYPHIVLTELISERMVRQQSVLAIVPNDSENLAVRNYINMSGMTKSIHEFMDEHGLDVTVKNTKVTNKICECKDEIIRYHHMGKRYIIKASKKPLILSQLDYIGINEPFIFPELHYEGKNIVKQFSSKANKNRS